jgi:hypothetical protein
MDAGTSNGRFRIEPLVEDAGENRGECAPQPRRPRGADRKLEPLGVEREARRHPAFEMVAGAGLPEHDVGLTQEVVELHVEARHPHACADTERVREHAGATLRVDRRHVRRVLGGRGARLERLD